jgi:tetratricopeptide (TPR) repeat protein
MKSVKLFYLTLISLVFSLSHAQPMKDTSRVWEFLETASAFRFVNNDSAIYYCNRALVLSEQLHYTIGIAKTYNRFGLCYNAKGDYHKAVEFHEKAMAIFQKKNYKKEVAKCLHNIGFAYESDGNHTLAVKYIEDARKLALESGDTNNYLFNTQYLGKMFMRMRKYEEAISLLLNALAFAEKNNDLKNQMDILNGIGNTFLDLKRFDNAIKYYEKGLKLAERNKDSAHMGTFYDNAGIAYDGSGNKTKAEDYYLRSLAIREASGNNIDLANVCINLGVLYKESGSDLASAETYFKKAIRYAEASEDEETLSYCYLNLAEVYTEKDLTPLAITYLNKTLVIGQKHNDLLLISGAYKAMANAYSKEKNYKEAYDYFTKYNELRDTIYNAQNAGLTAEMEAKFENEKKQKELIAKDGELKYHQAESEKQNFQKKAFIIGFALMIVLAFFIFRSYRQKRRSNIELEAKNTLIEKQKEEVEYQKELVMEKQKEIIDSINYAKRIQKAHLPTDKYVEKSLDRLTTTKKPR